MKKNELSKQILLNKELPPITVKEWHTPPRKARNQKIFAIAVLFILFYQIKMFGRNFKRMVVRERLERRQKDIELGSWINFTDAEVDAMLNDTDFATDNPIVVVN